MEVATAALVDAFNAAFSDYLITFPTLDDAGWQAFVRRQGIDVAQSRVACRGDAVVAFAMITPRPFGRTRIAVMGARPEARGSGAAKRLLDDAIAASAARRDRWIELEAFAQNERAVRLYRSRGFEVDDELFGFLAPASVGVARDEHITEISRTEAAEWGCAFDRSDVAQLPWQVGGEAILAAQGSLRAWQVGGAQLVFVETDASTVTLLSLIDRDAAQAEAVRLLAALRQRYPTQLLRAPQIHRANAAARALDAAGWEREPLYQLLMRRRSISTKD